MNNEARIAIILTFVETCYEFQCISGSLIRYTVEISNDLVRAQIVVKSDISDDEQDNLRLVMTYVAAQFGEITIDEDFIKISHIGELQKIDPLPVGLYRASDQAR